MDVKQNEVSLRAVAVQGPRSPGLWKPESRVLQRGQQEAVAPVQEQPASRRPWRWRSQVNVKSSQAGEGSCPRSHGVLQLEEAEAKH